MLNAYKLKEWLNWPLIRAHLCTLAICVSLNATWRVPREAFRFGGLAYGLVLTAALIVVALPVTLLQLAIGQLSQQDTVGVWRAVPFFRGIGYLRIIVSFMSAACSVIDVSISIAYFLYTATHSIPFPDCIDWIVNEEVYENSINASECLSVTFLSPVKESPEYYIAIAFLSIILWIASPFVFYNPAKFMKLIFYVLAPGVILLGIVILSCIGKGQGIMEMVDNGDWDHYLEARVWHSGIVQALWSSQIAGGYLISAGDSVYSNTNVQWTSLIIVCANIVSSWFWLLFWFGVGNGDKDQGLMAVLVQTYHIATEEAMDVVWPLLIFATLILSGVITLLTLLYPIYDHMRRIGGVKWRLVTFASSLAGAGTSLALLAGRMPVLNQIEYFAVPALICIATVFEILAFGFIYGWRTLIEDVEFLIGSDLKKIWVWSWWVSPGVTAGVAAWWVADVIRLETLQWMSDGAAVLAASVVAVLVLILCAGIAVARQDHYDIISKLKSSFRPSRHWGPRDPISHYYWLARRDEGNRGNIGRTIYNRRELGQLSRRPSFLTVSESVQSKDGLTPEVKRRSNSDDWLFTSARKQYISQLYTDEFKRSKSLDWGVNIKMKGSDIIRLRNDSLYFDNNNVVKNIEVKS